MGLKYENYQSLIGTAMTYFGDRFNNIDMLELGCQQIRKWTYPKNSPLRKFKSAKGYFSSIGIRHVSIDINGRYGSLRMDLSKPLEKPEWNGFFDCVTNFGTIEHVDCNSINGQHQAFKTMHEFTKKDGVMIHIFPLSHCVKGHCKYKYTEDVVGKISLGNHYDILFNDVWTVNEKVKYVRCVFAKKSSDPFMSFENFQLMDAVKYEP